MKLLLVTFLAGLSMSSLQGSITLVFSGFFDALTNLSDSESSSGVNGLSWGILVDTAGDGFGVLQSNPQSPLTLSDGVELTPGDFFFQGGVTAPVQPGFLDPGDGSIDAAQFDVFEHPSIDADDAFALIWFDSGISFDAHVLPGSMYGLLDLSVFRLPGDGSTLDFSNQFPGMDPIRTAALSPEIQAIAAAFLVPVDMGSGLSASSSFALDFSVASAVADSFSYVLEESTTLHEQSWEDIPVSPSVLFESDGIRNLRLTHPDRIGDSAKLFLRLRVEAATTP